MMEDEIERMVKQARAALRRLGATHRMYCCTKHGSTSLEISPGLHVSVRHDLARTDEDDPMGHPPGFDLALGLNGSDSWGFRTVKAAFAAGQAIQALIDSQGPIAVCGVQAEVHKVALPVESFQYAIELEVSSMKWAWSRARAAWWAVHAAYLHDAHQGSLKRLAGLDLESEISTVGSLVWGRTSAGSIVLHHGSDGAASWPKARDEMPQVSICQGRDYKDALAAYHGGRRYCPSNPAELNRLIEEFGILNAPSLFD